MVLFFKKELAFFLLLAAGAQASPCTALRGAVDAIQGAGPGLLASYPTATDPALAHVAFTYDNALAAIALRACGAPAEADRIAAALRAAALAEPDGAVRNAYRAGPAAPPALAGWWDRAAKVWRQDAYQVGSATGNLAWAALALPANDPAAARTLGFIARTFATDSPVPGYRGGRTGWMPHQIEASFESTEQNSAVAAAFRRAGMRGEAQRAQSFVMAMWDQAQGRFRTGTPDSAPALDAQLMPLLAFQHAPAGWQRAGAYVRANFAVGGGYGFGAHPDTLWAEGTAQVALALHDGGVLRVLAAQTAPGGYIFAAPRPFSTGYAADPTGNTRDSYFHLPALAPTAWAALAQANADPFTQP